MGANLPAREGGSFALSGGIIYFWALLFCPFCRGPLRARAVKLWPKGRHVILANHVPAYCTAIYITSEPSHLGSLFNLGSVVDLLPFPTVPSPLIGPNTVPCAVFTVFYIIDLLTPTSAIFCGVPGTGASNWHQSNDIMNSRRCGTWQDWDYQGPGSLPDISPRPCSLKCVRV